MMSSASDTVSQVDDSLENNMPINQVLSSSASEDDDGSIHDPDALVLKSVSLVELHIVE